MRDHVFSERVNENQRDEEVCRAWDVLAEEDHTNHMSKSEYFHYRQNWRITLKKSGNDTQPLRKRSDFKQALSTLNRLHQEAGGQQLKPMPHWKCTSNGNRHRVLPPPGGKGENPGGLPNNSKKVKKEVASKGLRLNGATRYLQNFDGNLRRMAVKSSFYLLRMDRLQLTAVCCNRRERVCKHNTSRDSFTRCVTCKNLVYRLNGR